MEQLLKGEQRIWYRIQKITPSGIGTLLHSSKDKGRLLDRVRR